jgi:hypothetical protein
MQLPCKTRSCALSVTRSVTVRTTVAWCAEAARCSTSRTCSGGNLPQNRAALIPTEKPELQREIVLSFPRHHRRRVNAMG